MIGSVEMHQPKAFVGPQEVQALRGGLEVVDELADEWRTLCSEAVDDQPFYRPEFIRAHIYNVLPHATISVITVRQRGRLRLVLPLVEELGSFRKVPLRKLRAPVNDKCRRFDEVCHASPEGHAAIRTAWEYLKALDGWDLLQFRDALEGSTVRKLANLARMNGFLSIEIPENPSPFVTVPSDPELLDRLPPNSKLRSQLRQARRRLSEQGSLKFSRISDADYNALQRFYQVEASGWKGRMPAPSSGFQRASKTSVDHSCERPRTKPPLSAPYAFPSPLRCIQ